MVSKDIRWIQRFQNFKSAYSKFNEALKCVGDEPENDLYQMALIKAFEFTFELGWKTIKDFLIYSGIKNVSLPREVIKQGFHYNIIEDGNKWIAMMQDRNLMAHTYKDENAKKAVENITLLYKESLTQVYEFFKNKSQER
ncbi:nucleotidyltransferase substrate binding protein [Fibrobacterota bacterium]